MRLSSLPKTALWRVHLGWTLALLFLLSSSHVYGQSGRNQQPGGKPTTPGATRPKRPGTTSDAPQPRATPTPPLRVPSGTVVLDEPPPPAPVPKPTPPDTSAGDDIGIEDVVRISSNLVTVPTSVVDSQGRAVINLKLEDFELRVDGQPRPISELSRAEMPVTLALLFDNSQSLSAAREFEKQAAVRFFRSVIRPIDRAAIYSVSTDVVLAQTLTNNVPALVRTIERFGKPEGATRLLDAIVEAAAYLRPYPGRKVIVIVSDGEDTLSDTDFDKVVRQTLAADCQVYAVQTKKIEYVMLTGQQSNANLQALAAERRMQDLTSHTGGAVYTPLETRDLDAAFAQISADLSQQYLLSYYPTNERQDQRFRTISVRVATRPNMRVRARRGYYPRPNEQRLGSNSEIPTGVTPVVEQRDSGFQTTPIQEEPAPALLSSSSQPHRATDAIPPRRSRMGPSDTSDLPDVAIKTERVEEAPHRQERVERADERKTSQGPIREPERTSSPAASASHPAPSQPSTPTSFTRPMSGGVLNGKALHLPMPRYPPNARHLRVASVVTVEVTLDEEGKVISARALDGLAFLRGPALEAARRARFTPTLLSGKPVQIVGVITYKFNPR